MAFLLALLAAQDGGRVVWRKDVDDAIRESKAAGLPVLLYFTSAG